MKKLLLILLCLPMIGFGQNYPNTPNNNYLYFPNYIQDANGNSKEIVGNVLFDGETSSSFSFSNGDKYKGNWRDGMRAYSGTYTWNNGDKYIGQWKGNQMHIGTYYWNNGAKYTGEWMNNQPNGQGTGIDANGILEKGLWKDGGFRILESLIKEFVEENIYEWQQKGEFEKTNDYLVRVNEKNRTVKIKEFQESAIESLKLDFLESIDFSFFRVADYDADNETFLLKDKNPLDLNKLGDLVISVPISEAKEFKETFFTYQFVNPELVVLDDKFAVSYVEVSGGSHGRKSKTYTYSLANTQDYAITDIDYEFSSIEIDDITSLTKTKSSNISTNKIKVGTSSVNINIPSNKKVKNRYALIIGNEDYTSFQRTLSSEQNVDYAVNDAKVFKEYCLKTLGVKEDNMNFLTNATAGAMNQKINKMLKLMNKLGNEAELIFYYAGHGYPDELTKVPYLIPVDVSGTDLSFAIKLEDLYRNLGNTNAQVTVFLDACFTGGGRNSGLVASRGVKVKPKEGTLNGNIVVFSASSGDQSALPYHQQGHGMFTYYLLKKFQESKGKVSMGELADYIHDKVSIQSININEKEQDPKVNISLKVINDWRNWKF